METTEIAAQVRETIEEQREEIREGHVQERFRTRIAILISVFAAMLAIVAMRSDETTVELIHETVRVNDLWAFFQAKTIRRTTVQTAMEQLQLQLQTNPQLTPQGQQLVQAQIDQYQRQYNELTSRRNREHPDDPMLGDGIDEIFVQARHHEHEQALLQQRLPNFHYSEAMMQLAIVIASVSIAANSRRMVVLGIGVAILGVFLYLNGNFLLVSLPGASLH